MRLGVQLLQLNLYCGERVRLFRTLVLNVRAISFSFFILSLFCLLVGASIAPVGAEPLKANIQFDDSLAPLQSGLREGERLNLSGNAKEDERKNLSGNAKDGERMKLSGNAAQKQITEWRRIPRWFAGTWHREKTTKYVNGRPMSYQTRADLITGYQQDAKGRIWQPVFNSLRKVDADEYIEYQMPQRKTIYASEKDKYTSFSLSTRIRVDKETGKIISSFQQEDLSVSTPEGDGVVKAVVDCRVFSQDGRVTFEDTIEVLEQRIEDFNPIDEFNGVDYRASFIRFLEEKGHSELIPPERPPSILTSTQERILSGEKQDNALLKGKSKLEAIE
ncbi:MAG: hypothetical protein C0469_10660 [Cyanobacteria bacterium DS2.3.42]|nr:hypothetical protein [Cyanobacteria bacterium DS2.3.42]